MKKTTLRRKAAKERTIRIAAITKEIALSAKLIIGAVLTLELARRQGFNLVGILFFKEPYIGLEPYEWSLWLATGGALLFIYTLLTNWPQTKQLFCKLMDKMLSPRTWNAL